MGTNDKNQIPDDAFEGECAIGALLIAGERMAPHERRKLAIRLDHDAQAARPAKEQRVLRALAEFFREGT